MPIPDYVIADLVKLIPHVNLLDRVRTLQRCSPQTAVWLKVNPNEYLAAVEQAVGKGKKKPKKRK